MEGCKLESILRCTNKTLVGKQVRREEGRQERKSV